MLQESGAAGWFNRKNGRKPNAIPTGGGGGAWRGADGQPGDPKYARNPQSVRSINTQEWAQRKIADGDIAGGMASGNSGTSIFDPVLCEVVYRWFSPPGGLVLDPFAGGSVRGVVASKLERRYVGIDLRAEQVAANIEQGRTLCAPEAQPEWFVGDSSVVLDRDDAPGRDADLVFSCPPYGDLERYSDLADDLSTMEHAKFRDLYYEIIAHAVRLLADDRFACFVVGDFRDQRTGFYRDFVSSTIDAFEEAGAHLYNEIILVTSAGSLPIRAGKQFSASRKVGKTHQNVLVFCKGDPLKAVAACGQVEVDESLFDTADGQPPSAGEQDDVIAGITASGTHRAAEFGELL
jgi:DNA modification methylase